MCDNTHCDVDDRILHVLAHSKDLSDVEYAGLEHEGYFPNIPDICSGDDVNVDICLVCGKVQGSFPKDHETICELIVGEDEDEDEYVRDTSYSVEECNISCLIITKVEVTEEQISEMYSGNYGGWNRFSKNVTRILKPTSELTDDDCVMIFKQLPIQLRLLGLIQGLGNDQFINELYCFVEPNADDIELREELWEDS